MENKSQINVKLAAGVTAIMLSMTPVLAGTTNAYAEGIVNNETVQKKYKEGSFVEDFLSNEDIHYNGYVVKKGDNTSKISEKICKYYNVEKSTKYWPVVAYLNSFPRMIKPGDIIYFPSSIEVMDELLGRLKSSNWYSSYVQYNGIYKNHKRNLTVGEVIDEIFGKGASKDPTFVRKYLKAVGMDPSKYSSTSELNADSYFKLTDWIPTTEELGMEPTVQNTSKKIK